jgi:hypothetical protein
LKTLLPEVCGPPENPGREEEWRCAGISELPTNMHDLAKKRYQPFCRGGMTSSVAISKWSVSPLPQ